jgi:SecD/SecF fusion protein
MKTQTGNMVILFLVMLFAGMFCLPPEYRPLQIENVTDQTVHLGLDLKGGAELRYRVDTEDRTSDKDTHQILEDMKEVISQRIEESGIVKGPTLRREGKQDLIIQLPGLTDQEVDEVKKIITTLASLKFRLVVDAERDPEAQQEMQKKRQQGNAYRLSEALKGRYQWYKEKNGGELLITELDHKDYQIKGKSGRNYDFTGAKIASISKAIDDTGRPVPAFSLKNTYKEKFGDFTGEHVGRQMAIIHNNEVVSAPVIKSRLSGGGIIEGLKSDELKELISFMKSGSLEFKPYKISENKVGPSLGEDAMIQGKNAGIWSVIFVVVFMMMYYRGCGVISILTMVANIVLLWAWLCVSGETLTLPGIGGLILTIGMAVDGNIIIFERIREERERGKILRQSVDAGFERANWTILDSNLTTLITAGILYYFGTGAIQGFAATLGIGIFLNLITIIIVSRILFNFSLEKNLFKEMKMMQAFKKPRFPFMHYRHQALFCSVALTIAGVSLFVARGHENFGLDFNGGILVQIRFKEPTTREKIVEKIAQIQTAGETKANGEVTLSEAKYPDVEVQSIVTQDIQTQSGYFSEFLIRIGNLKQAELDKLNKSIKSLERSLKREGLMRTERQDIEDELSKVLEERKNLENQNELRNDLQEAFKNELLALPFALFDPNDPDKKDHGLLDMGPNNRMFMFKLNFVRPVKKAQKQDLAGLLEEIGEFEIMPSNIHLLSLTPPPAPKEGDNAPKMEEPEESTQVQVAMKAETVEEARSRILKSFAKNKAYELSNPFIRTEQISGVVADRQKQNAVFAVFWSLLAIVLYITLRFEFKFGLSALVTLIHDVFFTLGAVAFANWSGWVNVEIDLSSIAAFLTIIGYSLNDTIVVFDRLRENLLKPKGSFDEIVNDSINQTLSRTLFTSLTTLFVVGILFFFNKGHGGMLEGFSFTMLVGVIVGTFSSIYVSGAFLVYWEMGTKSSTIFETPEKEKPAFPSTPALPLSQAPKAPTAPKKSEEPEKKQEAVVVVPPSTPPQKQEEPEDSEEDNDSEDSEEEHDPYALPSDSQEPAKKSSASPNSKKKKKKKKKKK